MATRRAPANRKATTSKSEPKSQAAQGVSAEGTELQTDESAVRLQQEQDKLHAQARVAKGDAEFIDPDPGYNKDQVEHMREYYGLKESTAEVAEV